LEAMRGRFGTLFAKNSVIFSAKKLGLEGPTLGHVGLMWGLYMAMLGLSWALIEP
jgi:hypothetical protein